jgi:hypothetical protein
MLMIMTVFKLIVDCDFFNIKNLMYLNIKINSPPRSAPFIDEDTVKKVRAELQERRISDIILGVAQQIANDAGGKPPISPSTEDSGSILVPTQDRKKG